MLLLSPHSYIKDGFHMIMYSKPNKENLNTFFFLMLRKPPYFILFNSQFTAEPTQERGKNELFVHSVQQR